MQYFKNPIFSKGRIVKKESLDLMHEFPKKLAALEYDSYSDGILYGFSMEYKDEILTVSEGACIYQGELILLEQEKLPFLEFDQPMIVKLVFYEKEITEDFLIRPIELKIESSISLSEQELELGRFCLSKGAVLRKQYQTLEDLRTAYNTLDITYVFYAGVKEATISPIILKLYAKLLLETSTMNEIDYGFVFTCLNQRRIEKETILMYLSCLLNESCVGYTNSQIYEALIELICHRTRNKNKQLNGMKKEPKIF